MIEPKPPSDEQRRLAKLREYDILDTLPEEAYDDIVALAAHICETPIALVSLVDRERQWFKARHGLDAEETPRSVSFCGHVVQDNEALQVRDAFDDERFSDNPLVVGEPRVRFYAGMPLRTDDGHVLGTLCVIDHEARELSNSQRSALEALSRIVMRQLDLRSQRKRSDQLEEVVEETQAEVEKARVLHERFFDISLDLLCVAGFDGFFKELNPAWSALLGYSEDELKAVPFIEFVHPDDREATVGEATKLGGSETTTIDFENRYRCKDGSYVWLSWKATSDLTHGVILAAARDVSTQKLHEHELVEGRKVAELADRAKSQFLATMSHELRTPLNAIIGFSKILSKNKSGRLGDADLTFVSRIRENGAHLLHLINEVLDLSKIEAGQMTYSLLPCSADSVVDGVIRLQESLARNKGLELVDEIPGGLDPFLADQHRLRQVLINLVGNAIKFTESGAVTVRALVYPGSHRVSAIHVVDTGPGIPEDQLDRIFSPFEQVDGKTTRMHEGTGLGLAISNSLADGMGMQLSVESTVGVGTTFMLSIPEKLSAAVDPGGPSHEQPAVDPSALPEDRTWSRRVLVIDDNADARELLAEQLREFGCEVRLASDGAAGLRAARGWRPDLITLDLMMPNANGWQVLAALRKESALADIPVVVVSMAAEESRGTLVGAVDVLSKPVQREDLHRVLQRVSGSLATKRALIIEDNADARLVLARYLEDDGWVVAEAVNGEEGFAALERLRPDVVFLDLMMPVMDGVEFLARVRDRDAFVDLPIVIVSAKDLDENERAKLLTKASAVVGKGADLEKTLRDTLAGLQPARP